MELVQDTESLVRLTSANSASDGEGGVEEKKEEDPLTKTSSPGGPLGLHGWPAHPAFAGTPLPPAAQQPNLSTLNKITSQFWGFDPSRPPTMPPHPLDSLSFPPSLFPSLSSHLFKLPPNEDSASR